MKKLYVAIVLAFASLASIAQDATFNSVSLTWVASVSPDVAGYRLYFSKSTNEWTHVKATSNVIEATVVLPSPGTWFFTLTATNTAGLESLPSNVATYTTPTGPATPGNLRITSAIATQISTVTTSTNLILWP